MILVWAPKWAPERPLSPPKADLRLILVERSANDPKATFAYFSALSNMTHDFGTIIGWIAIE